LDRAFDGIFVAARDTKAGVVPEISKCVTAVPNVRSSWCNPRAEMFSGCSVISLKLTVNQVSSSRFRDIENQRFWKTVGSVMTQN
jgi:hypothetical protein